MGVVLGMAAITKFNSLPVAAVLLAFGFIRAVVPRNEEYVVDAPSGRLGWGAASFDPRQAFYAVLAVCGFFLPSAWWFLRNKHLYGEFLATNASQSYLRYLGFFHTVPWNLGYFAHEMFREFWLSSWYLQPNLVLPVLLNTVLGICALGSVTLAIWSMLIRQRGISFGQRLSLVTLFAVLLGGILAVAFIIKSVGYSDARLAYVGISAFAIVSSRGHRR